MQMMRFISALNFNKIVLHWYLIQFIIQFLTSLLRGGGGGGGSN